MSAPRDHRVQPWSHFYPLFQQYQRPHDRTPWVEERGKLDHDRLNPYDKALLRLFLLKSDQLILLLTPTIQTQTPHYFPLLLLLLFPWNDLL